LEKAKVIRPYVPLFGSSHVSALLHILFRKKSVRRNCGLYKVGHGEKSVIWYWEFDVEKRYFHQFKTINYAAAQEFYEAKKFTMWAKEKEESDAEVEESNTEDSQEDGGGGEDVQGDFHNHTADHEYEDQRESETDVQGQDDGQNVLDDNSNPKDNDNQQDNKEERRGNQDIVHSSYTLHWLRTKGIYVSSFRLLSFVESSASACRTMSCTNPVAVE